MKKEARDEIYAGALDAWGLGSQLAMLAEEASELSVAALHCLRSSREPHKAREQMIEEMADTRIMIEQVCYALDLDQNIIDEMIDFKLARLRDRVRKARIDQECATKRPRRRVEEK